MNEHDRGRTDNKIEDLQLLGTTISIEGEPGFSLRLQSLEQYTRHRDTPRPKWLLLCAQANKKLGIELARVWISDQYRSAFRSQLQQFLDVDTPAGNPRNASLVANIASIGPVAPSDLWQGDTEPPSSEKIWWEIWLPASAAALEIVTAMSNLFSIPLADKGLQVDGSYVVWLYAHWTDLVDLPITALPAAALWESTLLESIGATEAGSPAVAFELDDLGIR